MGPVPTEGLHPVTTEVVQRCLTTGGGHAGNASLRSPHASAGACGRVDLPSWCPFSPPPRARRECLTVTQPVPALPVFVDVSGRRTRVVQWTARGICAAVALATLAVGLTLFTDVPLPGLGGL